MTLDLLLQEVKRNGQKLVEIENKCSTIKQEVNDLKSKVAEQDKEKFKIEKGVYQV